MHSCGRSVPSSFQANDHSPQPSCSSDTCPASAAPAEAAGEEQTVRQLSTKTNTRPTVEMDPASEIDCLPAQQAETEAKRMRELVDAALNGTAPSASMDPCDEPATERLHSAKFGTDELAGALPEIGAKIDMANAAHQGGEPQAEVTASVSAKASLKSGNGTRPMWAVTEDKAEAMEAAEEDRLLHFAEQLDIDSLAAQLSDAELAEAMRVRLSFRLSGSWLRVRDMTSIAAYVARILQSQRFC